MQGALIQILKALYKAPQCKCRGRAVKSTEFNSGVADQQSEGRSPSRDTCVLKQDTGPLLCPSDGT